MTHRALILKSSQWRVAGGARIRDQRTTGRRRGAHRSRRHHGATADRLSHRPRCGRWWPLLAAMAPFLLAVSWPQVWATGTPSRSTHTRRARPFFATRRWRSRPLRPCGSRGICRPYPARQGADAPARGPKIRLQRPPRSSGLTTPPRRPHQAQPTAYQTLKNEVNHHIPIRSHPACHPASHDHPHHRGDPRRHPLRHHRASCPHQRRAYHPDLRNHSDDAVLGSRRPRPARGIRRRARSHSPTPPPHTRSSGTALRAVRPNHLVDRIDPQARLLRSAPVGSKQAQNRRDPLGRPVLRSHHVPDPRPARPEIHRDTAVAYPPNSGGRVPRRRPASLGLGPAGLGTPPADTAAASVRSDTASRMSSRQIVLPDTWGAKDVQT